MKPGRIPTKDEAVKMLETIYKGLPALIEKAKRGTFETVDHEGMVVLQDMPANIVSVAIKESSVLISVI